MSATDARGLRRTRADIHWERVRCLRCGSLSEPPVSLCPHCGTAGSFEEVSLTPGGRLLTWVVQHVTPFAVRRPTILAVIETPEGGRVAGELVDCPPERITVGLEVEAVLRRSADPLREYEWKFRPVQRGEEVRER